MKRVYAEAIDDKKMFTAFYVGTIIYNFLVIRLILPHLYVSIRSELFPICYSLWAIAIVINDIIKKRLFDNKVKFLWNLTFLIAVLSMVFQPKARSIQQIRYLIVFGIQVYILVSCSADTEKEKVKSLITKLSTHMVFLVSVLNVLSLLIAVCIIFKIALPPWIIDFNNGLLPMQDSHQSIFLPDNFGRYKGLYISVPEAAFDCYVALALNLFLLDQKKIKKKTAFFNIFCCVLMIILTDARDVLINIGIITFAMIYFFLSKNSAHRYSSQIILLATVSVIFFTIYKMYSFISLIEIKDSTQLFDVLNHYSSRRLIYYKIGYEDFLKHKLLGNGWLNCDALFQLTTIAETHPNYHNCIINLLAWTGLIGTGSFLISLGYSSKKIYENRDLIALDHSKWLVVLCICIFIQSLLDICLFGEDTHIESVFFWVCLGYLVYLNTDNKRDLLKRLD